MIDLEGIQNWIIHKLWKYCDEIPIVPQNTSAPRPNYPFITYNWIVPYSPGSHNAAYIGEIVTEQGKDWFKETRLDHPMMTLSFNSYARDPGTTEELIFKPYQFFSFDYRFELRHAGIVVTTITPIQDRTTLLESMQYERRLGFDVRLRTLSEVSGLKHLIETGEVDVEVVTGG